MSADQADFKFLRSEPTSRVSPYSHARDMKFHMRTRIDCVVSQIECSVIAASLDCCVLRSPRRPPPHHKCDGTAPPQARHSPNPSAQPKRAGAPPQARHCRAQSAPARVPLPIRAATSLHARRHSAAPSPPQQSERPPQARHCRAQSAPPQRPIRAAPWLHARRNSPAPSASLCGVAYSARTKHFCHPRHA